MAILNVSPTRINLKDLRTRLKTANLGHKLLKDKNDELVRIYSQHVASCVSLRKRVEREFTSLIEDFDYSKGYMSGVEVLREFILENGKIECEFGISNVLGSPVPDIKVKQIESTSLPYAYASTNIMFDDIIGKMREVMQQLIKLSNLEKICEILSIQIEKNKRRVNALEHILIPNIEQTISYVSMKIDENDRAFSVRLTKSRPFLDKK